MSFHAIKRTVKNRGAAPDEFLSTLVAWGRREASDVFDSNPNPSDIYASVRAVLGPWESLNHRKAVMLEVMRVHAGFESSWNWDEGVDVTNKTSMSNINGQETGIFQVSFDSTFLNHAAMKPFAQANGMDTAERFIVKMKKDHDLALEYYARLVRANVKWAGPILRGELHAYLRRDAVEEFRTLLQKTV